MSTVNVRIPEDKRDELKVIASLERRNIKEILTELVEEYIERHQETLDLLSRPEWVDVIRQGRAEVTGDVKGKSLDELDG